MAIENGLVLALKGALETGDHETCSEAALLILDKVLTDLGRIADTTEILAKKELKEPK